MSVTAAPDGACVDPQRVRQRSPREHGSVVTFGWEFTAAAILSRQVGGTGSTG